MSRNEPKIGDKVYLPREGGVTGGHATISYVRSVTIGGEKQIYLAFEDLGGFLVLNSKIKDRQDYLKNIFGNKKAKLISPGGEE